MGMIGLLLEFLRGSDGDAEVSEAKCDLGGNDIITAPNYQGSGVDSRPLPGDYVLLVPGTEAGTFQVAGYLDPKNAGVARAGDVRLYVRDGDGNVTGEFHMTNDGAEPDWQATAGALIARADRLERELDKIKDVLDDQKEAINTHQHAVAVGCLGSAAILAPSPPNPATLEYSPESVGADKGWVT